MWGRGVKRKKITDWVRKKLLSQQYSDRASSYPPVPYTKRVLRYFLSEEIPPGRVVEANALTKLSHIAGLCSQLMWMVVFGKTDLEVASLILLKRNLNNLLLRC